MAEERERFYSRLATLPGIRPMPSIGHWILLEVDDPSDLARKVNRRIAPGLVSVPRHISGAVRIPVQDPRDNEQLFQVLSGLTRVKSSARDLYDLDSDDALVPGVG